MGDVKELGGRLERWTVAFDDPNSDFTIKVSSHGRLMLSSRDSRFVLTTVSAVQCMQGVIREYMLHGFGPQPSDPGPDLDPVAFMKLR